MSNLDNPNENNKLPAVPLDQASAGEGCRFDDETLAEYLVQTGKSSIPEVSVFAGIKKPWRPKPTFTFPSVPSLF